MKGLKRFSSKSRDSTTILTSDEVRFRSLLKSSRRNVDGDNYYDEYSDVEDEEQQKGEQGNPSNHGGGVRGGNVLGRLRRNRRASINVMLNSETAAELLAEDDDRQNSDSMGRDKVNSMNDGAKKRSDVKIHMNKLALCTNTSTLAELMAAAEADIATYQTQSLHPGEHEKHREERYTRQIKRDGEMKELKAQAAHILAAAKSGQSGTRKPMSEKLEYWEKALELFTQVSSKETKNSNIQIDSMTLLDMLMDGCHDEKILSGALADAYKMTISLVQDTMNTAADSEDDIIECEAAYRIKLNAHSRFMQAINDDMGLLFARFRADGTAAVKIGQLLETAEAKRRQCEVTSVLIRRWWMMETLAEKDVEDRINVEDEVSGKVPQDECKLDPLFTLPENSLEAAHALRSLRNVVQSSSLSILTKSEHSNNQSSLSKHDNVTLKVRHRFELTSKLISRISRALEARLLASFLAIYNQGGIYDFSTKSDFRNGRLDWPTLKKLAEGLFCFDGGRNIQNQYVNQVVASRFPEFTRKVRGDQNKGESQFDDEEDYDMERTRSTLSTLFHRVAEVCSAEFALIAHVFNFSEYKLVGSNSDKSREGKNSASAETRPLQVARALLHRIVSDNNRGGLQTCINDLLSSIKGTSAYDIGTKKLDTVIVIHEKVSGLFTLLRDAMERYLIVKKVQSISNNKHFTDAPSKMSMASSALVHFLNSQEIALSKGNRQSYLNLELRLLHHECCSTLEQAGARLTKPTGSNFLSRKKSSETSSAFEYEAPILELDKETFLGDGGGKLLMEGILKPSFLRQPLIHATDSLARAQLIFGGSENSLVDNDSRSKAILSIFKQMCRFYGSTFLFPIFDLLSKIIYTSPPGTSPDFGRGPDLIPPHDLGVDTGFWLALERIHSAAKAFDRELWAENKINSSRVWDLLTKTGNHSSLAAAKECRYRLFRDIEERGESVILKSLDAISVHIEWIISGDGGIRNKGPYALATGTQLNDSTTHAIKYATNSLRDQFVQIQSALSPASLSGFWNALSMRIYDCIITRLLLNYQVSTVGAIMLSRDVESLRSVSMLAGSNHSHWDMLRELLTLYMTPPDALRTILVGPEGEMRGSTKGLFHRAGQEQSLVFMSRRADFRVKSGIGTKKSDWALELFESLEAEDPSEGKIDVTMYSASRRKGQMLLA